MKGLLEMKEVAKVGVVADGLIHLLQNGFWRFKNFVNIVGLCYKSLCVSEYMNMSVFDLLT